MKCSSCGAWIEDGSLFCTKCGTKISGPIKLQGANNGAYTTPVAPVAASNKSNGSALYVIVIIVLVALLGAEGWFAWNTISKKTDGAETADEAQVEEAAPSEDVQAAKTESQPTKDDTIASSDIVVEEAEPEEDLATTYANYISNMGKGNPAAFSFSYEGSAKAPVCIALWADEACFLSSESGKISESWVATADGIAQVTGSYRFFPTMEEAWAAYSEATANGGAPTYSEGIHTYDYVIKDCTWDEAAVECQVAGGHLVTFETDEEYEYVLSQINRDQSAIYLIGGKGVDGVYHWLSPVGINTETSCSNRSQWMNGEPSFSDGEVIEDRMIMFYLKKERRWVWNDVPNEIVKANPSYSGKVGYICEYE